MAAPTYFASNSTPTDNGTQTEPATLTVTNPASMQAGDLVVVCLNLMTGAQGDWTMANGGGQTWNQAVDLVSVDTGHYYQLNWCTFNGTWTANTQWAAASQSGTQAATAVLHVFRPPSTSFIWALDVAAVNTTFAGTGSNTVSIAAIAPQHNIGVALGWWSSDDDNTWGNNSGGGWADTGTAQYRNLGGGDQSDTFAHYLWDAAPADTGAVSKTQLTLGKDAGDTHSLSWYAFVLRHTVAITT